MLRRKGGIIVALKNIYMYSYTVFDAQKFLQATRNQYKVVSVRKYVDKKGVLPDGYAVELKVLYDDMDYGVDKNGEVREDNSEHNFEVYIHSRNPEIHKGDFIRLLEFDNDHSRVYGFDAILRFGRCELLKVRENKVQK